MAMSKGKSKGKSDPYDKDERQRAAKTGSAKGKADMDESKRAAGKKPMKKKK